MPKHIATRAYKKTYDDCLSIMLHYGGTEELLQERTQPIQKILTAENPEQVDYLVKKALSSIEMYILRLWSTRKIPGPNTPLSIETKAKKAESLAKYLDKKAISKFTTPQEAEVLRANAEKQRKRAEALHVAAAEARTKEQLCPTPEAPASTGTTARVKRSRPTKRSRRNLAIPSTASSSEPS